MWRWFRLFLSSNQLRQFLLQVTSARPSRPTWSTWPAHPTWPTLPTWYAMPIFPTWSTCSIWSTWSSWSALPTWLALPSQPTWQWVDVYFAKENYSYIVNYFLGNVTGRSNGTSSPCWPCKSDRDCRYGYDWVCFNGCCVWPPPWNWIAIAYL